MRTGLASMAKLVNVATSCPYQRFQVPATARLRISPGFLAAWLTVVTAIAAEPGCPGMVATDPYPRFKGVLAGASR